MPFETPCIPNDMAYYCKKSSWTCAYLPFVHSSRNAMYISEWPQDVSLGPQNSRLTGPWVHAQWLRPGVALHLANQRHLQLPPLPDAVERLANFPETTWSMPPLAACSARAGLALLPWTTRRGSWQATYDPPSLIAATDPVRYRRWGQRSVRSVRLTHCP